LCQPRLSSSANLGWQRRQASASSHFLEIVIFQLNQAFSEGASDFT
jgi:hypothetical protein